MLTYSEVRQLVEEKAVAEGDEIGYERAHWFGWVFMCRSKGYLESGLDPEGWAGDGPLLVNRFTGNMHQFGSHWPPIFFVWAYQIKWLGIIVASLYLAALLISGLR